jgi:sec-independent protein translocase protein TatC
MAMSAVPVPDSPESDPETQIETRPDSDDEQRDDEDRDGGGGRMSFLDHLDELRTRLVVSVSAVFVGFLAAFAFIVPITAFVMVPLRATLPEGGDFIYTEPTEAFFLYIKVAALVGLLLALPVVLSQFWLFVAPGLYAHEKKFAIPFVTLSTLFFIGGCLFSHYLLFPVAWAFLGGFSTDYMTFMPRIQPTFSLYVRLMLACGVVFQMPTLVLFLARVGVLTARFLIRNTKYAILIIFIIAAVMTPTGDPATLTMMAAPMTVLYGVSIGIAWLVAPRRKDGDDL